ncbi:MAG: type II toxin-antitoxin system RelE/ParE family toxin [Firmicutes bacterium HGW-Firmicutes-3]|jgi:phage-related protein|nr:MAG: type II toxin-antitoxin system RelE/ParE family toxin [Firmicutes bacterium HGW-Firmicutes-3]
MYNIIYYEDDNGKIPILDFLRALPRKNRAKAIWEIDLLKEFGTNLSMPHVKKMSSYNNLWELRIKVSSNNYRVFYFHHTNNNFILLHGFHKKSQKTPKREIQIAIKRKNTFIERNENHES